MATVKCKCGNTYFARVQINQFKDNAVGLHTNMHEVEPDHDIKIYQCIACKEYMMPPINYFSSTDEDNELYKIIEQALQGKIVEKKKRFNKPIHKGTVGFVAGDNKPEEHGKFVSVE